MIIRTEKNVIPDIFFLHLICFRPTAILFTTLDNILQKYKQTVLKIALLELRGGGSINSDDSPKIGLMDNIGRKEKINKTFLLESKGTK